MDQSYLSTLSGLQTSTAASQALASAASGNASQDDSSFMDHVLTNMATPDANDNDAEATQPAPNATSSAPQDTAQQQPARTTAPARNTASSATSAAQAKQAANTSSKQTSNTSAGSNSANRSQSSDKQDATDGRTSASTSMSVATQTGPSASAAGTTVATTGSAATPPLDAAGKKKLAQTIDGLLNMLPAAQRQTALTQLQTMLGQSAPSLSATGTDPGQALIAAGLTPQQLTDLIGQLQQMAGGMETGLNLDELSLDAVPDSSGSSSALPATAQLTAPPLKRDAIFSPRSATPAASANSSAASDDSGDATTAQVNPLVTAGSDTSANSSSASQSFDSVMKVFEHMQNAAQSGVSDNPAAAGLAQSASEAANAAAATVQATTSTAAANALTSTNSAAAQTFPDGSDWASKQGAIGAMTPISGLTNSAATMTSLVNSASLAASTHPATEVVASAIMSSAEDGEDKDITVKLDPAELGKVEVQMKISKDNSVSAHIVVEKPETYMMLQRDQHVLQRALQNSGLDANGNSLSFELAQNGMNFAKNSGNGNSNGDGSGSSPAGDETGTVLETTLNWSVDPTSGQTHYNLLA